jgi:D-glycero-D-manno-heptose 1,7-bisphosphate phosphatase
LRTAGFSLVMVTNQPEIARGIQTSESLNAINRLLQEQLQIESVRVCPHDDNDGCSCRKPEPGMLLQAAHELRIDLGRSFLVGDRWRDVEAGRRAGCRTVLIAYGYQEPCRSRPDFTAQSLSEAADWILGNERGGEAR